MYRLLSYPNSREKRLIALHKWSHAHSIGQTHSSTNSSNGQIGNYHFIIMGNPTYRKKFDDKSDWPKWAQGLSDKKNERKRKVNDSDHWTGWKQLTTSPPHTNYYNEEQLCQTATKPHHAFHHYYYYYNHSSCIQIWIGLQWIGYGWKCVNCTKD